MSSIFDGIGDDGIEQLDENLRKWFKEKWVRFGPDGKIRGACARGDDSEGKPKCLPQKKAHALGKKGRKYAAAKKRREDPNPERRGPAKNVATKKKTNEGIPFNQCPHCGNEIVHESMMNEKQDACYHKVKARYKVWPSAYASGALVQCRKKGAANWGNKTKKNESNIMKGLVAETEMMNVIYVDGHPLVKYVNKNQAETDAERMKKKFPHRNVEVKREMHEAGSPAQQAAIAINMKKHHKKPKQVDEAPIYIKSHGPDDPIEIPDEYKYINIKTKPQGEPKEKQTNFEVWGNDHGYYVFGNNTNAVLSAWPNGEMMFLVDPRDPKGRENCMRFAKQAMKPVELKSLPGPLRYKILQNMSSIDQPLKEGVIVGHDANDPDVAIIGGAGTYKLSNVKKKAQMEANELAKDIMAGKFKNSAINIKQLANTLNTIVAAEDEMEKKYFGEGELGATLGGIAGEVLAPEFTPISGTVGAKIGSDIQDKCFSEDYTGEFAAEVTPAINPYGGLKDKKVRGAIGEALLSEMPDTSGAVGVQPGGWRKYSPKPAGELDEDTAYAGGMGQGGNAGQSYRKFKPKSAGTFKEEQLDEKCWDSHKQVGMKKKGGKMVPNCVPKESAIMKGLTGKRS